MYKRLAEIASEYLRKGSLVYIEGKIRTRKWIKDGIERYTTEIIASEMKMLGGKTENEVEQPKRNDTGSVHDIEEDIPF